MMKTPSTSVPDKATAALRRRSPRPLPAIKRPHSVSPTLPSTGRPIKRGPGSVGCLPAAVTAQNSSRCIQSQHRLQSPLGCDKHRASIKNLDDNTIIRKPSLTGATTRRCQSLSPTHLNCIKNGAKHSLEREPFAQDTTVAPESDVRNGGTAQPSSDNGSDKDAGPISLPHCVVSKMVRTITSRKREFFKMRKHLISQQNNFLEQYAILKEMETKTGASPEESLGEVRILSVTSWAAHDLLLLVRDDMEMTVKSEISGVFGPQVLTQLHAQLNPIPEEMLRVGAEIMARRIDLLNLLRGKHRTDRVNYLTNLEWKAKNLEFDNETERLHRLVAGTAENLKAKINYTLELAKVPWVDRDQLIKKIERLQKENLIYQHKLEEVMKKACEVKDESLLVNTGPSNQVNVLTEELAKERAARDSLKDVVSAAESMLRVARARIATLERQLKETRGEMEAAKRKHKDLEQLVKRLENSQNTYRHRETSYDARSKKLLEVSKNGEITIESLSRQRDALEFRVKELREHAEEAAKLAAAREAEQRSLAESLQVKLTEQEKRRYAAESRVIEQDARIKELEENLFNLRERSGRLVDMERKRCLDYLPSKENEPTDRETEIWKELQVTRLALSRTEEELRLSKADKESFLQSLSKIAQEDAGKLQDKMATELLEREQKITKLQHIIDEQKENEKIMEQSMTQYENQLASLRLEVKRLRNYDCYAKEISAQDLQTEMLELHMQVEVLSRERTALVTAAASRALMLERHERAADLFARITKARRDLTAFLEGRDEPLALEELSLTEVSRSLSSVCTTAADTWTALRAERARVLRLESAVLSQSLQLEREGRVRTQLERRRAILEREILRVHASVPVEPTRAMMMNDPSLMLSRGNVNRVLREVKGITSAVFNRHPRL